MSRRNRPRSVSNAKLFHPDRTMSGRVATGAGTGRTTSGLQAAGSLGRGPPPFMWKATGSAAAAAGSGSPDTGGKSLSVCWDARLRVERMAERLAEFRRRVRREAVTHDVFGHDARDHGMKQGIAGAGLRAVT